MKKIAFIAMLAALSGCSDSKQKAFMMTIDKCEPGNKVSVTTTVNPFWISVSARCEFIKD